jgi:hypothetical protein
MSEYLDRYLEGWVKGDLDMVVSACAEDFVIDDPVDGRFTKAEYGALWEIQPESDIELSEIVTEENGDLVSQWGWFKLGPQEGAFLNKAGPDGVHLTRIAYYKR